MEMKHIGSGVWRENASLRASSCSVRKKQITKQNTTKSYYVSQAQIEAFNQRAVAWLQ